MKAKKRFGFFLIVIATMFLMFFSVATAQDKVVVIPLWSDAPPVEVRPGSEIFTNSIGMKFSLIPAGSFVMGSPAGTGDSTHRPIWPAEAGRGGDERQHVVTLTDAFYMQTTEVTQGQWGQVMGSNPSHFSSCGSDCPVEMVSWYDAQNFIDALNARENRTNCDTTPNTCYSLPSESQWEYAARGGTVSAFYNGGITNTGCTPLDPNLDAIGWYCGNAVSTTHPVAQKEPNNWGLYDMSGNVWEWCNDWYGTYPDGPVDDPTGGGTASFRVIRGGGWYDSARYARSAYRHDNTPGYRDYGLGFRLGLPPGQ
jgi:formylglycine-generating enzyme required for sulfatase activity